MEQPIQPVTTTVTKGIVISLILIVFGLVTYFLDLNTSGTKTMQWVGYFVFIAAIIWSVNIYGKQIDYNATFGSYFSHGFKTTALVTLIMIVFAAIFIYLFPDIKEKAMEAARKEMQEKNMTGEQISKGMGFMKGMFMILVIGTTLFFYLFFGLIGSLIGAAVTKKNPVQFTDGR